MNRFLCQLSLIISVCVFCYSTPSSAVPPSSSFLSNKDIWIKALSPEQRQNLESFFQQVLEKLPPTLLAQLDGRVQFGFDILGAASLNTPSCGPKAGTLKKSDFESIPNQFVDAQRIETTTDSNGHSNYLIRMNSHFLSVILRSESSAATYDCGHRNLYKYAQAVVVREIAKIYDELNFTQKMSKKEYSFRMMCAYSSGPVSTQPQMEECKVLSRWTHTVSDRPTWTNLRHFKSDESPEIQSLDFAHYMEFYTLDPEFPCRKPSISAFFDRHFEITSQNRCSLNTSIPVNASAERVVLNPAKLYQIHLLLAESGEKIESKWGHIMFRLVFCSEKRTSVGPECLSDVSDHIVVGFLGAPNSISISNWDGMWGKYPSELVIQPYSSVLNEYTVKEARSLTSLPLKLSDFERKFFLYRALEDFWNYQGSYKFFSNNCATEALNFLGGVFQTINFNFLRRDLFVETPKGLFDFLIKENYVDASVLKIKDSAGTYVIKSPRKKWHADTGAELLAQVLQMTADQRRALYEKRKAQAPTRVRETAISFYEAEMEIYTRMKYAKDQVLQNFVEKDQVNLAGDYLPLVTQFQALYTQLGPHNLASSIYGVPLAYELKPELEVRRLIDNLIETKNQLENLLRRDQPNLFADLKAANSNMRYFYQDIKLANTAKY